MRNSIPEILEAVTPLTLATIGAVIGVVVLVQPAEVEESRVNAGLGLAGTAIAGAAGLARTARNEQDFSVRQKDGDLNVRTPATDKSN